MKDVNLKNLKTTGVYTHSNKKPKEKKSDIIREKKSFSLGRKKDMIISDSSQENSRDRHQQMKEYLLYNFRISGIQGS